MQTVFQPDDRRIARASAFRRHPEYESPRDRDQRAYREELARDLREFQAIRDRVASARVLETGWPS